MTDNDTLLGFIAQRHTIGLEDVATDALCFILSGSQAARGALSDFLGDGNGLLPVAKAEPWAADAHGSVPDLACLDDEDDVVALIESKFWAHRTRHQPITCWEGLPDRKRSVLLFLAPEYRINHSSLWAELVQRLQNAGHELDAAEEHESLIIAGAKAGQRRLILTSWRLLLDRMSQRALEEKDWQAAFEIAELQGLSESAIAGDSPQRDANLKRLMRDAIRRLEQSGWANTSGLSVGQGFGFYVRYLRLAGAFAWLGIDYKAMEVMPDKPLWLSFYSDNGQVPVDEVRERLGDLGKPGLEWRSQEVSVPIPLPPGADREATLDAIVVEMERVGRLIDPEGPTYRELT